MTTDTRLLRPGDLRLALGLLSRLPVRADLRQAAARGALSVWAFPLVGLALAALAAGVGAGALALGLAPVAVAVLVLAAQVALTGAMHEDGLADSADGLWGGWDPARRLAIMKDSHIGAYGVVAVVLALLARAGAYASLAALGPMALAAGLLVAAAISRASIVQVMTLVAPARPDGLAASVGQPGLPTLGIALALAALAALGLAGPKGLLALVLAAVVALLIGRMARRRLGGQTGDILGATQQMAEITVLLVLTASL